MTGLNVWRTYRTVVLSHQAQQFVDSNSNLKSRFVEQWMGVEWLLARTPELGTARVMDRPFDDLLFIVAANHLAQTTELWILYSYDTHQVNIQAVSFPEE